MATPTAMRGKLMLSFKSHLQITQDNFLESFYQQWAVVFTRYQEKHPERSFTPAWRQARCWKVQTPAVHCLRLWFHCSLSLLSYQPLLEHHLSAWHLFPGQITRWLSMLKKQKSTSLIYKWVYAKWKGETAQQRIQQAAGRGKRDVSNTGRS